MTGKTIEDVAPPSFAAHIKSIRDSEASCLVLVTANRCSRCSEVHEYLISSIGSGRLKLDLYVFEVNRAEDLRKIPIKLNAVPTLICFRLGELAAAWEYNGQQSQDLDAIADEVEEIISEREFVPEQNCHWADEVESPASDGTKFDINFKYLANKKLRDKRLLACTQCEFHRTHFGGSWCSICKCNIELKSWLRNAACPIGPVWQE
ncbi:hypothetical protein MCERH10_01279 [Caulobacteraceae bacterium]